MMREVKTMMNLKEHLFFTEYADPKTGIKSYILKERVADVQKHFYFTNTSVTEDGKFLWILCATPPAKIHTFAIVSLDAQNPYIKHFLAAGYSGVGNIPGIFPGTHDLIFAEGRSLYKVTENGEITRLYTLPDEIVKRREIERVFTHASFSCDKKKLVLDVHIANKTYVGFYDFETKETEFIDEVFVPFHNHAQFSTKDPNLLILDQEGWTDPVSGEHGYFKNRTWLLDTKGTRFEPLIQSSWFCRDGSKYCHDFWSKDGYICFNDYDRGAFECDDLTRELTCVWNRPICHTHTNYDRSLWVADESPYHWKETPCKVLLYDRETKKEIEIFSGLPYHGIDPFREFHIDPHPAFTDDGEYIVSTTTVLDGRIDVAITPVKEALEICRKNGIIVE